MNREKAIEELKLIAKVTMWNDRREAVEMAIEALKAEPVRHGEWVKNLKLYQCSECDKVGSHNYKYCPHCGAKMSKGGGNECR